MDSVKRPLSPHLQVYKPQLTSVLSITHRATGVFLSLGALFFSCWLVALASGAETFANLNAHINAWYGKIILLAFVFSLFYHLSNGVRHLFWDAGYGLQIETTYKTGYAVIASALILTLIAFFIGGGA